MLYAFSYNTTNLAVAAASSVVELQLWFENVRHTTNGRPQNDFDPLMIPTLKDLPHPAYLFEFDNTTDLMSFVDQHRIDVIDKNFVLTAQENMDGIEDDFDDRPIGEILGLTEDDPWDKANDFVGGKMRQDVMLDQFSAVGTTNSGIKITDVTITANGDAVVTVSENDKDKGIPEILYVAYEFPENATIDTVIDDLMEKLRETKTPQRIAKIEERVRKEMSSEKFTLQSLIDNVMNSIIRDQIDKIMARKDFNPDQADEYTKMAAAIDAIPNIDPNAADVFKQIAHENVYGGANVDVTAIVFCQNDRLTATPAFGGKDVPVFHVKRSDNPNTNPLAPQQDDDGFFDDNEMRTALALRYGLTHMSNDLFVYRISPINPNFQIDIKQHLINEGMVYDQSIQPAVRRLDVSQMADPSDLELIRSLTQEDVILPTFNDYVEGGVFGFDSQKDVSDQDANLNRFAIDQLDPTLQKMLKSIDDEYVFYGDYNGPYVNDRVGVFTIAASDRIVVDGCFNVVPLGGTRTSTSYSVMIAQRDIDGIGILTLKTQSGVKVYRIDAPKPKDDE